MKKSYIILFLLMCVINIMHSQEILQGKTGPNIVTVFPLTNDINLKETKYPIIYPLLVLNNLQIKDEKMINCFRNHFNRKMIKKIKRISQKEAEKKGILNVPKDGVLFVTTKKDYYFDFPCK